MQCCLLAICLSSVMSSSWVCRCDLDLAQLQDQMWCIFVCHPLLSHSCLGTGMRGGAHNKFCHYRASLVHLASSIVFSCGWFVGGSSITILPLLVQIIRTFATVTIPVLCVLVNTLQYHDTVDLVQDSEKEDPQLVAETKPWQDNGKESMRTQQWDHGWTGPTSKFLSSNTGVHVPTMETRSSTLAGNLIVAEEPAGWMALETAQRRKSDSR